MASLALAAISARMMAESAAQGGFEVLALDLFGDRDTRAVSGEWAPIGTACDLRIDTELTLQALRRLAQRGDVAGWVAGSGFEALPGLLEQGAVVLPLLGCTATSVRRVRDPATFFGFLDSVQIAHPVVSLVAPADTAGWLVKSALGTGGWHIREASTQDGANVLGHVREGVQGSTQGSTQERTQERAPGSSYFQRRAPGMPMSATFIANGHDACLLGFNELIVRSLMGRPFVFCGAVGPVPLPARAAAAVTRAVRLLAAEFALRGACSLDFMLDGDEVSLLEVNPRHSASMAGYAQHVPQGVMAAHVLACVHGQLPMPTAAHVAVHGHEIVFACRRLTLDDAATSRLAQQPHCHDLPFAAMLFDAGDPVCSVSALAVSAEQVRTQLSRRREALLNTLETA